MDLIKDLKDRIGELEKLAEKPEEEPEEKKSKKEDNRWERIKNETITIRLARSLMNDIRSIASKEDCSISEVFRDSAKMYVKFYDNPELRLKQESEMVAKQLLSDELFLDALRHRLSSKSGY